MADEVDVVTYGKEAGTNPPSEDQHNQRQAREQDLDQQHGQDPGRVGRPAGDGAIGEQPHADHHAEGGQEDQDAPAGRHQEANAYDVGIEGDGAETVDGEPHEVHVAPARDPHAPRRRYGDVGDGGAEHGRGVVAPQLRGHDEVLQVVPGHDAEVAHTYGVARQQPMEEAIEMVEEREDQPFGPPRPLGEHDVAMTALLHLPEEGGDVRRAVLTVAVHYEDGLTGEVGMDVREPHRDRPLMSQVPAQAEMFDLTDRQ